MLPGGRMDGAAPPETPKRKRRKMSAAGRRAIATAQRKIWAEAKKQSKLAAPAQAPKPKRRISKEGIKRIIAATKKRWVAVRAAKAQ